MAAADSASTVIKKYSLFIYSEAEPHAKYAIYKHTRKFRVLQYSYLWTYCANNVCSTQKWWSFVFLPAMHQCGQENGPNQLIMWKTFQLIMRKNFRWIIWKNFRIILQKISQLIMQKKIPINKCNFFKFRALVICLSYTLRREGFTATRSSRHAWDCNKETRRLTWRRREERPSQVRSI